MDIDTEAAHAIDRFFTARLDQARTDPFATAQAVSDVEGARRRWQLQGTLDTATTLGLRMWVTTRLLNALRGGSPGELTQARTDRDAVLLWLAR